MHLRPYSPADWRRLCEIHDSARKDELAAAGLSPAYLTLERTAHAEGLFEAELIVAEVDDGARGFVAFSDHELTWLYVDPRWYRRGIGRALLKHAIAACAGELTTEVLVGNDAALALYLSEGFVMTKRVDGRLTGHELFAASGYLLRRS
jgi:GNAT superfamily N-acetyltransferase